MLVVLLSGDYNEDLTILIVEFDSILEQIEQNKVKIGPVSFHRLIKAVSVRNIDTNTLQLNFFLKNLK